MAINARYLFGEAWSIARSGARQTIMAIALIALGLYVPGLLVLLSGNLGRLATMGGLPPSAVATLEAAADPKPIADTIAADPRVQTVRVVTGAEALDRFRKSYPDLGAALADLKE